MGLSLAWITLFLVGCGFISLTQLVSADEKEGASAPSTDTPAPSTDTATSAPATTVAPQVTATPAYEIISPENAANLQIIAKLTGHGCSVFSVHFSPDNRTLASTSCDQTLRLWDLVNGGESRTIGQPGVEFETVFTPDGSLLAAWSIDNTIMVYDTASGSVRYTLEHTSALYGADISPDGKTLVAGSLDGTLRRWDLSTGTELPNWSADMGEKYGKPIRAGNVSFSPDGRLMTSADDDDKIRFWDVASGTVLRSIEVADLSTTTFSTDGSMLVVETFRYYNYASDHEYIVKIYDVASGIRLNNFSGDPDKGQRAALSPDGRILAVAIGTYKPNNPATDGAIVLFDVATGNELLRLPGGQDLVSAIVFSPDGRLLASGGSNGDRTIRLWAIFP
jgi:WD40 repeat protein